MLALLERPRRLHRAQRGDDHRDPALVVAGAGAVRPIAVAAPSAGTANPARTPCRGARSAAAACRALLPACRATRWPARPAAFMSIHSVLKPSCSNSGATMPRTASTPGDVHRPAVLVDPALEHGESCAAARHRRSRIIFCSARTERGGGGRWRTAARRSASSEKDSWRHAPALAAAICARHLSHSVRHLFPTDNLFGYSSRLGKETRVEEVMRRRSADRRADRARGRLSSAIRPTRAARPASGSPKRSRGRTATPGRCASCRARKRRRSTGASTGCGRASTRSPSAARASPPSCSTPASTWGRRSP